MADPGPAGPPGPRFTTGPDRRRSPVPRHRRGGSRVAALLGALVLLAAVVAVGGAVTGGELDSDQRFREFVRTGAVGEPVRARTFEVTVLGVRTAAGITEEPDGPVYHTGGVWVLVRVRAVAGREATSIGYAAVRDGQGRTSVASGRLGQPLVDHGYTLQPGIPVAGEVAFEVPPDAATGLTVRFGSNGVDLRLETVAEVPLPVDQAMVAGGLAAPGPVLVQRPEVVPGDRQPPGGAAGGSGP